MSIVTGMATVGGAELAAGVVPTACSFVLCFVLATSENMGEGTMEKLVRI